MTLRPALISLAAIALAAACTSGGDETSSSSASSSGVSSSTSSSGGGEPPCSSTCDAGETCLETWDNTGANVASLRLSQLSPTEPIVLASGTVATIISGAINPKIPTCGFFTGGSFTWLVQLDFTTSTLTTGGALPVPDIFQGYTFFQGDLQGIPFAPVTAPFTLDPSGALATTTPIDLNMPIFLDEGAASLLPLLLRSLTLSATLSSDHNCVGTHPKPDPINSCIPDSTHTFFKTAGQMDAHLLLEEADAVDITTLGQSLCVLLSGDPGQYGDGGSPMERCVRDSMGEILFHGDWCSATDAPATSDCYDALRISALFAASAVKINP